MHANDKAMLGPKTKGLDLSENNCNNSLDLAGLVTLMRLILVLFASATLSADELSTQRDWESADGRKITAAVLELRPDSKTVKMKRSDGLVFTIEFEQFASQ